MAGAFVVLVPGIIIFCALCAASIYLIVLIEKYLKSGEIREEKKESRKTLGEVLRARLNPGTCRLLRGFFARQDALTQEYFVYFKEKQRGMAENSAAKMCALGF